jgi:DNA-binding CsgD family transcriptional regulator
MVIGRDHEVARIEGLLARARLGTSEVLVISGEPGIGKTALLDYAIERADGMTVLTARGVESEAEIAFAGLSALLRPTLGRLDDLPVPQAAALRGALGLAPGLEGDRFLIGAATLSLLAAHAEQVPVLVVIDDAQWVDESSLGAILFAARRLFADALALVITTRPDDGVTLRHTALPTIELQRLDRETAAAVLEHHAARPLAPGAADRLFEMTLGNPLALVELASAAAELPLERALSIETSVEHAFVPRIATLDEPARRLLSLAAAEDSGDLAVLGRAASALGLALSALAAAERAGLITVTVDALAFCHPLARSAAYRHAPSEERRACHRALAQADADPDRRAWHWAAAVVGPDAEAARGLEQAGERARARGAYTAAATAFERAARLTAALPERARRLFAAGEAAWLAGHGERAGERLAEAREACDDDALLIEIDHLCGHAALWSGHVMQAHDILVDAAGRAAPDRAVLMLAEAADACGFGAHPEMMLRAGFGASRALSPQAGERARFFAALAYGMALTYNGRGGEGARWLREAIDLLEHSDVLSNDPRLLSSAALGPLWLRDAERSRLLVTRAVTAARGEGAIGTLPFALWLAARDAATSDRLAVAVSLYEEAIHLARETGQATSLCAGLAGLACVEARQGREAACREHVEEALTVTRALGLAFFELWALDALADLELGLGHVEAGVRWLEEKERLLAQRGIADPDVSPTPELIEALLRLDRAAEARPRLEAFALAAEAKGQPWSLARLARSRALLADVAAEGAFDEALRLHALTPDRFEEARTSLCLGEALRRDRQRVRSRAPLRLAIDAFESLGALPWAERARLELLATGETARQRVPATIDQLTPRELQVALALADGQTTREAAAELFLSPKTVDYHLRHVYRKLAINSREALADALADA